MRLTSQYDIRHAISTMCAVLIAFVVNYYYSFSHEGWIVLTAFIASLTTRGTPFKQAFYLTFVVALAVMVAQGILMLMPSLVIVHMVVAAMFVLMAVIIFYYRPLQIGMPVYVVVFPLMLLIAAIMPQGSQAMLADRLLDILVGASISVLCAQFICPVRPYQDLATGIMPILHAFDHYSMALSDSLSQDGQALKRQCQQIQSTLESSGKLYPEWVFEAGYNPGLRSGHRFFLVGIERISELFFSLNYLASMNVKDAMNQSVLDGCVVVCRHNSELIRILLKRLNGNEANYNDADYTDDVNQLEVNLKQQLPGGLELLSFTEENVQLANFVRDLKDIRSLLMQLILSLPE